MNVYEHFNYMNVIEKDMYVHSEKKELEKLGNR